ncbi:hypothetical protein [Wolbachia endosymbiont of Encarsia formosa]|uniref:hypothetical protein n=1 Tax=Wolbachia endosymbiont of Encarsia formosa TaxID=77125 RepID=UPI0031BAB864
MSCEVNYEWNNEQLFSAVLSNNIEEAERLINAEASVHSVDKHGMALYIMLLSVAM